MDQNGGVQIASQEEIFLSTSCGPRIKVPNEWIKALKDSEIK